MAILVESEIEELTPGLKFELERRIGRIYRKASKSVKKVSVTFANVMDSKGIMHKQCRLILDLVGAPTVMVVARRKTVETAFSNALGRASMALDKRKILAPIS